VMPNGTPYNQAAFPAADFSDSTTVRVS
jgi:hypothetical protein